MNSCDRRDFLKETSAAVAAASLVSPGVTKSYAVAVSSGEIPPHRATLLEGVHAYTDRLSFHAGQVIRLHVSSTRPYELQVCRLGNNVNAPDGDEVLRTWKVIEPVAQAIHPGSYIHVEKGLAAEQELSSFTLECWLRRWRTRARQGVITQYDFPAACGFGLFVEANGGLGFYLGDGGAFHESQLHRTAPKMLSSPGQPNAYHTPAAQWHHVVATWDGNEKAIWLDGKKVGHWPFMGVVRAGGAHLRIGAYAMRGLADGLLDADLAVPAIYDQAFPEGEVQKRLQQRGLQPAAGPHVRACWPLTEEKGDRAADSGPDGHHGRIINHACWMIGGPSFNAAKNPYVAYDPTADDTRGHGLRLASDDLYDCRWQPTHEWRVPEHAKSGVYVGRIRFETNGQPRIYHTLFIVKKPANAPKASIAFLCATNTWKAYSATPFCDVWPGLKQSIGNQGYQPSPSDPAAYCFYRRHAAGQPAFHMGFRMPWPAVGPYVLVEDLDYSHLVRAERHTQVWLEQNGYEYDAISDLDLHRDPHLLNGYKVLFIVGHSEYWSREAYEHLGRYLAAGGNVVCLSGNTMYWRVSFNDDGSVIECRKIDGWGAQIPPEQHGECYHEADGKRGGVPRDCGFPCFELLGLEFLTSVTMGSAAKGKIGPYRVNQANHFLFQGPKRVEVQNGDLIAGCPDNTGRQPIGHEVDALPSLMKKNLRTPPPPGSWAHPDDPPGIVTLAEAVQHAAPGHAYAWDYYHRNHAFQNEVCGQIIYWKRPQGGTVFNAGSIAAGWTLAMDPKWSGLLKNVLAHFEVQPAIPEDRKP